MSWGVVVLVAIVLRPTNPLLKTFNREGTNVLLIIVEYVVFCSEKLVPEVGDIGLGLLATSEMQPTNRSSCSVVSIHLVAMLADGLILTFSFIFSVPRFCGSVVLLAVSHIVVAKWYEIVAKNTGAEVVDDDRTVLKRYQCVV